MIDKGTALNPRTLPVKLYSIQYLRAVAALAVVTFHAGLHHGFGWETTIGAAGVDIFFVISGFVMWTATAARPLSSAEFFRNRLLRIAPTYWIVTLFLVTSAVVFPTLFPRLEHGFGYTANSLMFIPMRSADGQIWPVLSQGWTLNYEMFFYLIFALGLFFSKCHRLIFLSAALVGLVSIGMTLSTANVFALTYTDPLMLEFLAGVGLGYIAEQDLLPKRAWGFGIAGTGLLLFAIAGSIPINFARVISWGIPSLSLVVGVLILEVKGGIPRWRAAETIGDASYSIYLTHGLAISVLVKVATSANPIVFTFLAWGATIFTGIIFWTFVERPIISTIRRFYAPVKLERKPVQFTTG